MKTEYLNTHLAKTQYIEGAESTANFKRLSKPVFRAKRTTAPPKVVKRLYGASRRQGRGSERFLLHRPVARR